MQGNVIMDRTVYKKLTAILVFITLIPIMCSCSFVKKGEVITAATEFGEALQTGKATSILKKTDGLDKEYKKLIKSFLNTDSISSEGQLYITHMLGSLNFIIDGDSVTVDKDTATAVMTFTLTDYEALNGGDYKDIDALCSAIDNGPVKTIEITVEFKEIEKNWYVTNFDDEGFKNILSFYTNPMPAIGRSTLLADAALIAESVVKDEPPLAINLAASGEITGEPVDMPSYLNSLFDVNGDPSDEDKAFRAAVLSTMTYEVDESTLQIDPRNGSVDIKITMADYTTLADKTFKKASDIAPAVQACPTITYTYTCHFIRIGDQWFATDLNSSDFAQFLLYKKFSVSMKNIDGTYQASLDITDKFIAYVASTYQISMPSDLEGRIVINSTLTLKDGKYEVTIDRDAFVANIKTFVETNIDKIIQNMLGTSNSLALDGLAKVAGYKNYEDMRQSIMNDVTSSIETINTSGLESSGTFTLVDDAVTLKSSANDTMPGTIDSYGTITVTSPVNDADAKKLLGSDKITLEYKKV